MRRSQAMPTAEAAVAAATTGPAPTKTNKSPTIPDMTGGNSSNSSSSSSSGSSSGSSSSSRRRKRKRKRKRKKKGSMIITKKETTPPSNLSLLIGQFFFLYFLSLTLSPSLSFPSLSHFPQNPSQVSHFLQKGEYSQILYEFHFFLQSPEPLLVLGFSFFPQKQPNLGS